MDLFKDEKYESLDEISQIIEPFECKINEELSLFPDEITVDYDFMIKMIQNNGSDPYCSYSTSFPLRRILTEEAHALGLKTLSDHMRLDYSFCRKFFAFSDDVGQAQLNLENKSLSSTIKIVKIKIGFEDTEIESDLKNYMKNRLSSRLNRARYINRHRINELLDLFGSTNGLKTQKLLNKVDELYKTYIRLIEDKSLNIKDTALFHRFVDWNIRYIVDGNLPSLSNITKVKIMMRKGLPIYSIKEDTV